MEGIKDLILRTQFLHSCPSELITRIKIDKVNSLGDMKEMAQNYFEACGRRKRVVPRASSSHREDATPGDSAQNSQSATGKERPPTQQRYPYGSHERRNQYGYHGKSNFHP